jgi:uncharacterized protein
MKQQVVAIHGGTSFDSQEEYIDFLKTRELTLERLTHCDDWRSSLGRVLGEEFEVLVPKMPNATNARYAEWSIWFERCLEFIHDDAILIGHSLGGIFLAKYLACNTLPVRISATIFVAAPFNDTSTVESLNDFAPPNSLEKVAEQSKQIYLIHSQDDPAVPFEQLHYYEQAWPGAHVMALQGKGHIVQDTFPELVELLKSLRK